MKEQEISELFNKELDALLQEGKEPAFGPDPGAMALAVELARADFSGRSLIKESLRERLAGSPAGGFLHELRSLLSNNYARAALAAAMLVVALLPLARRRAGPAPGPAPAAAVSRLQEVAGLSGSASREGLFASIPMASLESEPIKGFPITSAGAGAPVTLAEGREVKLENGSAIVFETESGVFTLERRTIAPEDLFERRVI